METNTKWRCLSGSIQHWTTNQVCWWHHLAIISLLFHRGCRLSRKVSLMLYMSHWLTCLARVLMGCIKSLGWHLCPRCLAEKVKVYEVGSGNDMIVRTRHRVNNEAYWKKIEKARRKMFKYGKKISSRDVAKYLEPQSLTPIRVCDVIHFMVTKCWFYLTDRAPLAHSTSTYSFFWLSTSSMSSSWVSGKQYLST